MKIRNLQKKLAAVAIAGMVLPASFGWAQSLPTPGSLQPAASSVPAVQLTSGAQQVLQLSQAKISDDTIIAFVRNSLINYNLDANQLIYLRQQGISNPVIAAMLDQSTASKASALPTASASASVPMASTPAPAVSTDNLPVYTAPPTTTTTAVTPVPSTVYYDDPYAYDPYYYGYYPYGYPGVGLYFGGGWGGGWHGGGGYHGGGGFHGGGGGFHGGGGGGHGGGHR